METLIDECLGEILELVREKNYWIHLDYRRNPIYSNPPHDLERRLIPEFGYYFTCKHCSRLFAIRRGLDRDYIDN